MTLLIDTDAFCKLAVCDLLGDAIALLGVSFSECARLPALPHMLRRGRIRKAYGQAVCDAILPLVDRLPILAQPSDAWLDMLVKVESIDPGEAQILAAAAEHGLIVLSGDKRALRALKNISGLIDSLAGRIIVLEAILIALCDHLGSVEVAQRIRPLTGTDKAVQICFSNTDSDPRDGLYSYYNSLVVEVAPLVLWNPRSGGKA
jgi:hypothetical protein